RQELQWLEGELDWVEEAENIQDLLSERGYQLKKLNARKQIMQLLEARYDELPERDDMLRLLQSGRYCGLLLNLSSWILSHAWQP
ncbi:CHAD domain-containing protein, partial [Photobacterium damselae]